MKSVVCMGVAASYTCPNVGVGSQLAEMWEDAIAPVKERGVRVVNARIGVVLDRAGGALPKMLPPYQYACLAVCVRVCMCVCMYVCVYTRVRVMCVCGRTNITASTLMVAQARCGWHHGVWSPVHELPQPGRRSARHHVRHSHTEHRGCSQHHVTRPCYKRYVHSGAGACVATPDGIPYARSGECSHGFGTWRWWSCVFIEGACVRQAVKLLMGAELAQETALASQRVLPTKLMQAGFSFHHPTIGAILEHALRATA